MFGKKAKELNAQLEKVNQENEELKKQIASLEEEIKRLKDQEASVSRAITEAGKAAARIEDDANAKRDELLAQAEQTVRTARENADEIRAKANMDADAAKKEADEYVKSTKLDADSYYDNTRTNVNIYVERTIMASQLEVRKRQEVVNELNDLLRKTTDYLTEQNNAFIKMLESVISENEINTEEACREIDKCSCSCKDCKDPCSNYKEEENAPEETEEAETDEAPAELPDEYESPAQLMQNIYMILKRQLPEKEAEAEAAASARSEVPVGNSDALSRQIEKIESELPHDDSLSEILNDMV